MKEFLCIISPLVCVGTHGYGMNYRWFFGRKIHGSSVDGQKLLAVRGSSGHCSGREPTMLCSATWELAQEIIPLRWKCLSFW